jgi:hypothetical protein
VERRWAERRTCPRGHVRTHVVRAHLNPLGLQGLALVDYMDYIDYIIVPYVHIIKIYISKIIYARI